MKKDGVKSYHPYLTHDKKHDQMFIQCALEKMLDNVDIEVNETIVICHYHHHNHDHGLLLSSSQSSLVL